MDGAVGPAAARQGMTVPPKTFSPEFLGGILGVLVVLMVVAAVILGRGYNLLAVNLLMVTFLFILGWHQNNRLLGILINERNVMSLSRFQAVVWTTIILSAYMVIAFERIRAGTVADPLGITIDWRIWALMGISMTSLIGTPLIQSNKKEKEPEAESLSKLVGGGGLAEGLLYVNSTPAQATFIDMLEGDEVRNTDFVDLAKVQMFFFTIIAAITYEGLLLNLIRTVPPETLDAFPALSEGFLAILGISHCGYLTSKSITSTPTVK
ncbi:MAG: hypothetical protein P4N41_02500 [Negativicutes bacterium]|nr:hypothetical protein [Negativicutes bacterium]